MRIARIIGYTFMALVLAGGWAFIYWQSSSVDLAAVDAARTALAELRAADSGWNQQLVNARLRAGGTPGAAPQAAVFSPLEDRIVTVSDDGTALVWNVASGAKISEPFYGHEGPVYA
ncbi:MAG: hypothetical protein ABI654_06340, partial [Betaproteobacteria bacterium]